MDNKYIKIIKGTPLFQGMSDEEIAQFLRPDGSGIKSFRKESYIFHAGDKTAYFGILLTAVRCQQSLEKCTVRG